jgi:GLPGLI family protein
MKTILITIVCLIFTKGTLFAQHRIIKSGSIEFEKSVNTFAIIKKMYGANMQGFSAQAFEQYQKSQPQFKVLKSVLIFNDNKTLFTPVVTDNLGNNFFGDLPQTSQRNTIYTDLSTNISTNQKGFFEETFLLKDTVRKINWKITDETREIAGYTCRRANAIILDSIYVVAFYTNDIHVSGGPESFTGLPGMILELALPHDNVIWRATKVNEEPVPAASIAPAKKGKPVNQKQFMEVFNSLLKNAYPGKRLDMMKLDYLL